MNKNRLESSLKEIEEIRSRLQLERWDFTASEVRSRLHTLDVLLQRELGNEIHKHIAVASVAALQTFHRAIVISIVDSGEEYKRRAAEMITERFTMKEALVWLGGKSVTFGELTAHTFTCNNVTDLVAGLQPLLDRDLKQLLADAIDPFERRNRSENATLIIDDVERLLSDLAELFQIRHILAHEAASTLEIDLPKCRRLLTAAAKWVKAIDAILWETVYSALPLTQYEMNIHAREDLLAARKEMAVALKELRQYARTDNSWRWVWSNHKAWMKATTEWSKKTYGSQQGTMWPAIYGKDLAKAIRSRVEQIKSWSGWYHPEG